MPAVGKLADEAISANYLRGIDPGTVVAAGSALQGAVLTGEITKILLLDIVPYSLGIAVRKEGGTEGDDLEISNLIKRNSTIPTKESSNYTTTKENQTEVDIEIYQGESSKPHNNYFLGNFVLDKILPAKAGIPKIDVTFEIDSNCILTVSAVDAGTGNKQSMKIEGAVALSPIEKENLCKYFAESENILQLENDLKKIRAEIEGLQLTCNEAFNRVEQSAKNFFDLFHEKVELNARLYKVNIEQTKVIQNMFAQKDQFVFDISKYKDQFATIINNLRQTEIKHFDFSDKNIVSIMQERINALSKYKKGLENVLESIESKIANIMSDWILTLQSMEPDIEKMNPLDIANYHLIAGSVNKAKELLESVASGTDGLSKEAFYLLLSCYIRMGSRKEYREIHNRYSDFFEIIIPDFNQLNTFLKDVEDSVFMIQGISQQHGPFSGSGFCIAPDMIVTNRHVIEGATASDIKIIGKNKIYKTDDLQLDPFNDLAILRVSDDLRPFRLGEFNFVEPGEQVVAIGFPSPNSDVHSENIYISRGVVNSIRNIDASSERVIFIDTKIGGGMSGGPLINDLGEVVGIVTLIRYGIEQSEKGIVALENQPVALPIHLVRKYLMKSIPEKTK